MKIRVILNKRFIMNLTHPRTYLYESYILSNDLQFYSPKHMFSFRIYPKQHVMIELKHIIYLSLALALTVSTKKNSQA